MTEWGPALTGPECKQLRLPGDTPVRVKGGGNWQASLLSFNCRELAYYLPADHPAYKVAEYNRNHPDAPMVYHGGSDEAPKDWRPGDAVMFAGGAIHIGKDWVWKNGNLSPPFQIISYVPTPVEEARPVEESDTVTLKRMTEAEYMRDDHGSLAWAKRVGLIRKETLFEQMKREHPDCSQWYGETAVKNTIEWMGKRQGDKS